MSNQTSGTYRALEILLGIVALAVSVLALAFPEFVVVTLVVLFGIALIAVGILRLATSASNSWVEPSTRKINIAIGALALLFGVVILFAPVFATETLVILIGLALLIYGVGRIAVGGAAQNLNGGLRALLIVVGLMVAVFALVVIFFPVVGIYTYAFFVSISFLLIGIESIASGIAGSRMI